MDTPKKQFKTIDEYIGTFSADVQAILQSVRKTIREAAPDATEAIRYQMPTFILNKNLVHFAAFKNHIGFYPTPSGVASFKDELSRYVTSKGAIRFPIQDPIPFDLVRKIVKFRVEEILKK